MNSIDYILTGITSGIFVLITAFLVACEFSLIRLRYSHFNDDLIEKLKERRALKFALTYPDQMVKVARMGILLCTVCVVILLYPPLKTELAVLLEPWGGFGNFCAILIAGIIPLGLQYVVGEVIPRGLAFKHPINSLRLSTPVTQLVGVISKPLLALFAPFGKFFLKLVGCKAEERDLESLDIEIQLQRMGEDVPTLSPVIRHVIKSALGMSKLVVQDALLPRNQIQYFDLNDSNTYNLDIARRTGHTRFPLCEGDLDHCIGILHIKDLFRLRIDPAQVDFRKLKRDILRVTQEDALDDTLTRMLRSKTHMALVVDEFGGTVGVITLERILEQLVGEIQDEFDAEEVMVRFNKDGTFTILGLTPIHDVEEKLDITIDNDDVSTFGGLITAEMGRIPEKNEELRIDPLEITITEVDETRVISTRVRVAPLLPGDGEDVDDA